MAVDLSSNQVVGFADFGPCRDKKIDADSELYAIYLKDSFWGRGIGKKLFSNGFEAIKMRGYTKMVVSVFTQNLNAKIFYEKLGGQFLNTTSLKLGKFQYPTVNYIWKF